MNQIKKFNLAVQLLNDLNCPETILEALWVFGLTVQNEEVKKNNWIAGDNVVHIEETRLLTSGLESEERR